MKYKIGLLCLVFWLFMFKTGCEPTELQAYTYSETYSFQVEDKPVVTIISPANNAEGVSRDAHIIFKIEHTREIKNVSISVSNNGNVIDGNLAVTMTNPTTLNGEFIPTNLYPANATIVWDIDYEI